MARIHVLITMGDPAGIGPEVLLRSLVRPPAGVALSVLGDPRWLRGLARRMKIPVRWGACRWMEVTRVAASVRSGRVQPAAGRVAREALEAAVEILRRKEAQALVTAPVSKEAMVRAGGRWIGHTEYLASRFKHSTTMMFVSGKFRVALATTHVGLKDLPRRLSRAGVARALKATEEALVRHFGLPRPRIGLAALNPHAGEGGLVGKEERQWLRPVVRAFQRRGGRVEGPVPADHLMRQAVRGQYDAVVALYHDQALIPLKLIGWERAVNLTLGLPFVRTSPVHGTAFDIAGRGKADPSSMRAALRLAAQLTLRREGAPEHPCPRAPEKPRGKGPVHRCSNWEGPLGGHRCSHEQPC